MPVSNRRRGSTRSGSCRTSCSTSTALARPEIGTTVTPTVASAGTTRNSVPESATLFVDVRATTVAEQDRVHQDLTSRTPRTTAPPVAFEGGPNRPPLERQAAADLYATGPRSSGARWVRGALEEIHVGGGPTGTSPQAWVSPPSTGWERWATELTPAPSTRWWRRCCLGPSSWQGSSPGSGDEFSDASFPESGHAARQPRWWGGRE